MSDAPPYACFGCTSFANNERLLAYHRWACRTGQYTQDPAPLNVWALTLCGCEEDSELWTNPVDDDVCWYDPLIPESAEFLGVQIIAVEGLRNSTFTRELLDRIDTGSILSEPTITGKSFVFTANLIATTASGMDYGLEWMRRQFEDGSNCPKTGGTCASCQGQNLTMRINCPTDDAVDRGLRTWATAGTVDGIDFLSDVYPAGKLACNIMRQVTWTMSTELAESVAPDPVSTCVLTAADDGVFRTLGDCSTDEPEVDACMIDPGCPSSDPFELQPRTLGGLAPCFGDPVCRCMGSFAVGDIPAGYDATMRFTLFAGFDPSDALFTKYGLRNTVIRVWENPQGLPHPTDQASLDAFTAAYVAPCAELGISWIPAGSEVVIDGVSGNSWLKCNGLCYDHSGRIATLSGPLFPITLHCTDVVVTIEWDCLSVQGYDDEPTIPSSMKLETFIRYRT